MKRAGNLFGKILDPENLRLAFWKASRGKRCRADQRCYAAELESNLEKLRAGLEDGSYPVGSYRRFTVHDPKEREICAAAFGERVLHHALMNVCEPYFDRGLVPQTFACRKGYGQMRAVAVASKEAGRYTWYLKCDVRKYFDSIPHDRLRAVLARKFKDVFVLGWFDRLIRTYETTPGCGLPIGNLTSQHWANLYLDDLDRFVLERKTGIPNVSLGYERYMDDFVVWTDDKESLLEVRDRIGHYLVESLQLSFKQLPIVQRTSKGMDFLGQRVYPWRIYAARKSLLRFLRKRDFYERLAAEGFWDEAELQHRVTALTAFLRQSETLSWRRCHLGDLGCRRNASGSNRVLRGGSWNNNARNCRSANRNNNNPSNRNSNNGFRLCCCSAASSLPVG